MWGYTTKSEIEFFQAFNSVDFYETEIEKKKKIVELLKEQIKLLKRVDEISEELNDLRK